MVGFFEDVLWLLVLIGVMINIHELGHFLAAKWAGVGVERFSLGFGPKVFGIAAEHDGRVGVVKWSGPIDRHGCWRHLEPPPVQ